MKFRALLIFSLFSLIAETTLAVEPATAAVNPTRATSEKKSANTSTENPQLDYAPLLADYYQEVNQQLTDQLKTRPRDPFSNEFVTRNETGFTPDRTSRYTSNGTASASQNGQLKRNALSPNAKTSLPANTRNLSNNRQVPLLSFKGFMESQGKKAALLEINSMGTFVVHEGDHLGLQAVTNDDTVIQIVEITELNVVVQTGSLGGQSQQFVVQ